MSERTHFVYTAWDTDGRPLYVGCTKNLVKRIQSHRGDKSAWLAYVDGYSTSGPYTHEEALKIERERILDLRPHFNWLPEYAAAIQARHRDYAFTFCRAGTARLDRMYGIETTKDGRHRKYKQIVRAERRQVAAA